MSLRRRNVIAWILLALAAISWTNGQRMIRATQESLIAATTEGQMNTTYAETVPNDEIQFTFFPETSPPTIPAEDWTISTASTVEEMTPTDSGNLKMLGFLLCFAGAALAIAAVFILWQKSPILGPDGVAVVLAVMVALHQNAASDDVFLGMALAFGVLISAQELWGWLRRKVPLSWCLVYRLAKGCPAPQWSLMVYVGWIAGTLAGSLFCLARQDAVPMGCTLLAGALGIGCLWKYGADLQHFEKQLNHFQQGLPITVKEGAFSQTEAQLLDVQAQHEEAVRTAVTSERFKVELISNVSHDLRTPLTSILGYGELLRQESLSPAGQEQLRRLNQKAGYMRDLVESLFELTKVSSGVIEAKQEEIDLIRLLEQTIGLFDDQLTQAGLLVRRHYEADSIPLVTDGSRIHQVFANLLGNAIKYALPGTRIHLEVKEREDSWFIRMVNTSSYEMDFQPEEILQRFARGDKARSTKGSGLGLAIAQTYTESVGGRFTVAVDGDQFSAMVELPKTERNL